jgi:hypothetical protein
MTQATYHMKQLGIATNANLDKAMELQGYMRWVIVSITSTRDLGQHMSNLQSRLLGLNLLISTMCEDHVWFEDRWMVASLCDE